MARHKVEICGVNTANLKVLKNDEMLELFEKYYIFFRCMERIY